MIALAATDFRKCCFYEVSDYYSFPRVRLANRYNTASWTNHQPGTGEEPLSFNKKDARILLFLKSATASGSSYNYIEQAAGYESVGSANES
ncbi:MAG: hypothetical protein FWD31_15565 [Planctomycetaceae bacterium]|nr:hypothetical protein [Planctomycetaceae bacterium]